ncbi:MAG: PAS domain S-box protein [Gemmataceae bacterium]
MQSLRNPAVLRGLVAVAATGAVLIARLALGRLMNDLPPTLLFGLAVMTTAWYGGRWPGLLATGLSAATAAAVFMLDGSGHWRHPGDPIQLSMFLAVGGGVSIMAGAMHAARRRAEADAAGLRRSQGALRQSEERYRLLAEAIPKLVWMLRDDGQFEFANGRWFEYTGRTLEQVSRDGWAASVHSEDRPAVLARWPHWRPADADQMEMRFRRADGAYRWFMMRVVPVRDAAGQVFRWVGTATDIEDEKRRIDALRRSERRYRALVQATPQAVWSSGAGADADGAAWWSELTGREYPAGDAWAWLPAVHPDDRERARMAWDEALRSRTRYNIEYRVQSAAGDYRHIAACCIPLLSEDGQLEEWIGTLADVTAQRQAEEALQRSHQELEDRVRERTADLEAANENLMTEVALRSSVEAEHRQLANQFRLLLESTGEAVVGMDPQGRATFVNQAAAQMLGWQPEELIGCNMHAMGHHSHADGTPFPAAECRIRVGYEAGEVYHSSDETFWRRDGTSFPVECSSHPLIKGGQACGGVVVFRDITARRRDVAELRAAKNAAEAASRAKGEFLANMSHEVRTPLNGILGMAELALRTALSPQQREYIFAVKQSGEALLTVINDILDFSKIEAGKLDLDPVAFNLRGAMDELLKPLALRARNKGLDMTCSVAPDVPDGLLGDLGRLRQVLLNLVGNAIKFTESGEVAVSVRGQRTEDSGQKTNESGSVLCPLSSVLLEFVVRDTGVGIPADKLHTIFAPFEQADGSTARRFGGTGLGLTISARLVDMMGGRLRVESEVGRGSTFSFGVRLPVQTVQPPRPPAAVAPARPLHVLLAEDNPVNQRVAVGLLGRAGHTVEVAATGAEAVAAATFGSFDVILMDVQMPEMDGLAATAAIRRAERAAGRHTPIVALTAHAMKGDRERFLAAGLDGYVSKPFRLDELWAAVAACALPSPRPAFDPAELLDQMGGDRRLLRDVLTAFEDNCDHLLREVHDALAADDRPRLTRAAHALKGALLTLGAPAAADAARCLEEVGDASACERLDAEVRRLRSGLAELQRELPPAVRGPAVASGS